MERVKPSGTIRCPHCKSKYILWLASHNEDETTIDLWQCKECRRHFETALPPRAELLGTLILLAAGAALLAATLIAIGGC